MGLVYDNESTEKKLLNVIKKRYFVFNSKTEKVKSILEESNNKEKILNLNIQDQKEFTPLSLAAKNGDVEITQLLIKYAIQHNINLELFKCESPFYWAIEKNEIEIFKLLLEYVIQYAIQHNIPLEWDGNDQGSLFYYAIRENRIEIVKMLLEYANRHSIVLKWNGFEGLFHPAIYKNRVDIVKLLLEYTYQHNITLPWDTILYYTYTYFKVEIAKLLLEYANQHNITFDWNGECIDWNGELNDNRGNRNLINRGPLFWANYAADLWNDSVMVEFILKYAIQHNITLEWDVDKELLHWIELNKIEMVKLLLEYAHQHNIIIEWDVDRGPLRLAMERNNKKIVKILLKEKEKMEKERLEKGEREGSERERLERERLERERLERERLERERLEREKSERERIERERLERERLERERLERERLERERIERERLERERIERENNERERLERERLERERLERENKNKNKNNDIFPKVPTLVIATINFDGENYDHLDIKKDEFLIVTDWNYGDEGWVYGHRKNNKNEKGTFPKAFIKIYKDENNKGSSKRYDLQCKITPEYRIKFENKIKFLRSTNLMKTLNGYTSIEIQRNNLFNDAYNVIMNKSPQELRKRLEIVYKGEDGIDAGGLLRDFFYQISKEIGNPNYSLFQYCHDNSYELEINPNSGMVDIDHLIYFRFIGRIIGLAIFHKHHLSVSFPLLFYKRLLNKPLEISDLEYFDPQLFKNLQQTKNTKGVENLYLTFSMDIMDCFGNHKTIDLKPNGANIDVNDSNKDEYIDLVIKYKLNNSKDKEQLNSLKQGFYEIIPQNINTILDEIDLKFLISGINEIDMDDWERNTVYEGYKKDDITIINFWKCVRKFSPENRMKLLLFATGNSQVPVTGFKDLLGNGEIRHFKLKKVGSEEDLPKSHTCFNRIDLPPYSSLTTLRQKLLYAIQEGMSGFFIE